MLISRIIAFAIGLIPVTIVLHSILEESDRSGHNSGLTGLGIVDAFLVLGLLGLLTAIAGGILIALKKSAVGHLILWLGIGAGLAAAAAWIGER